VGTLQKREGGETDVPGQVRIDSLAFVRKLLAIAPSRERANSCCKRSVGVRQLVLTLRRTVTSKDSRVNSSRRVITRQSQLENLADTAIYKIAYSAVDEKPEIACK
jgi:hypothetical protein